MSILTPDSGFVVALALVALLSLLAAAADRLGVDSRPTDWPDGTRPVEHHS